PAVAHLVLMPPQEPSWRQPMSGHCSIQPDLRESNRVAFVCPTRQILPRIPREFSMNLRQLDKKYFGRQGEPQDVIVGNSADSYLTDARGRKYIDFMMGWCVGNLGWGNTEIRAAARKFDGPDYVHPNYLYRPWVQLAEMLARITPGKLAVSYRTPGG